MRGHSADRHLSCEHGRTRAHRRHFRFFFSIHLRTLLVPSLIRARIGHSCAPSRGCSTSALREHVSARACAAFRTAETRFVAHTHTHTVMTPGDDGCFCGQAADRIHHRAQRRSRTRASHAAPTAADPQNTRIHIHTTKKAKVHTTECTERERESEGQRKRGHAEHTFTDTSEAAQIRNNNRKKKTKRGRNAPTRTHSRADSRAYAQACAPSVSPPEDRWKRPREGGAVCARRMKAADTQRRCTREQTASDAVGWCLFLPSSPLPPG